MTDNGNNEDPKIDTPIEIVGEKLESTASVVDSNLVKAKPVKVKRAGWVWLGILFVLVAIVLGLFLGYQNGITQRLVNQESKVLDRAAQQLELSYQDMAKGSFENAKKRLEYILSIYPGFPGVPELLADVNLKLNLPTPTPTIEFVPTATPEITSTPDFRAAEEIFAQIEQAIAGQQWSVALDEIGRIRESNYDFRTVDVDGFYYIALRNDGMQKIYTGQLEQGMFELSNAEQLGGLDGQADGARSMASWYITAASHWDTNWPEAIRMFGELSAAYPGLTDSSGLSTTDRYRLALSGFAAQINNSGDPCGAISYYQKSLAIYADPNVQQAATFAQQACDAKNQPTAEAPTPSPETTSEPPLPTEAPTEAPTPTP
ncbi:MAG: hypothetical protein WBI14_00435 [Anaerolineaceae bacterium]